MTKKVSIFGLGRSGLSALKAALKLNFDVFVVNQGKPETWENFADVKALLPLDHMIEQIYAEDIFATSDLIIISPGIPSTHDVLVKAVGKRIPILSEIEFGLQFTQAPIVAITGTNGKTTTTSMIGEMFSQNGLRPFVCGNIGTPVCDLAFVTEKYDVIVMEVSSFQLETIKDFHPHVALILNITPNHGERYHDVHDYAKAKFNIVRNMTQDDHLIYHADNEFISKWAENLKVGRHAYHEKTIKQKLSELYDLSQFHLVGDHNLYNLYCAGLAVRLMGNHLKKDLRPGIQLAINSFKGVPHRIEFVGSFSSGKVYNDAKSTNILSTLTAMKSFEGEKNLYLILGGKKRGNNDSLKDYIPEFKKYVKKILLIGETASMLNEELKDQLNVEVVDTFENALEFFKKENSNGVLLLSPSYPSFDQFKNYGHRGDTFKKLVQEKLT
jgi:UDP-N-acetylmuramoylalanine--D-glutamate ligase